MPSTKIITSAEYNEGYVQIVDGLIIRRKYQILDEFSNGEVLVEEPKLNETPVHRTSP